MGETKITNKMLHELYTLKHNISSPLLEKKHMCPNCNFSVTTIQGLNDFFGTRIINGKPIPQSWCRRCRKKSNKYYQE